MDDGTSIQILQFDVDKTNNPFINGCQLKILLQVFNLVFLTFFYSRTKLARLFSMHAKEF